MGPTKVIGQHLARKTTPFAPDNDSQPKLAADGAARAPPGAARPRAPAPMTPRPARGGGRHPATRLANFAKLEKFDCTDHATFTTEHALLGSKGHKLFFVNKETIFLVLNSI